MDYKSVVMETPHVVQYLRKSIVIPTPGAKSACVVDGVTHTEAREEIVKCGAVVAIKENGVVRTGWSVCADRDNFSNNKGKAIALLRAKSGKNHHDNVPDGLIDQVLKVSEKMAKLAEEIL